MKRSVLNSFVVSQNETIKNVSPNITGVRFYVLKLTVVILFFISLSGCEKQPAFERLNDISGEYTITKALFTKLDNKTDSVTYTNFGSMTISACKRNSFQNCPGDYKIGTEAAVSMKASYIFGTDGVNILQIVPEGDIAGWNLFGQYRIMEESDNKLIVMSGSTVMFNDKPAGRVLLVLEKK